MQNAPKTRASLILRLKNREDLDAWHEFEEIYQPLVFRLAVNKGFQHSDAADIAQEVLIRVAGAVERWDPDTERGSFRGWLYRIARNLMVDFLQQSRRRPKAGGSEAVVELIERTPDAENRQSQLYDEEFKRQVFAWASERIRSSFQSSTWDAFWRTAVEDAPVADVASQLNLSTGAVYIARSRVIQRLRMEVEKVVQDLDSCGEAL